MSKANSQTLTVRLPTEIAQNLMKLRNEKNLMTIGSALKYWIDEQLEVGKETKLLAMEEKIEKVEKLLNTVIAVVVKTNWKVNVLAHPDGLENREGEEVEPSEVLEAIDQIPPEKIWKEMFETPRKKK